MRPALKLLVLLVFALLAANIGVLSADEPADASEASSTTTVSKGDLEALQLRLDNLKQQVSLSSNYTQLVGFQDSVQLLLSDTSKLEAVLLPEQAQLQAQLNVLGTTSATSLAVEKADLVKQRTYLTEQKDKVDDDLQILQAIKLGAANLITQIASIRRTQLETELVERTTSLLNPRFWSPLFSPLEEDKGRLSSFNDQFASVVRPAWQPGERGTTVTLLLLALAFWSLGRRLAERGLTWICIHRVPEGRLRRSSLAISTVLATLLSAGCAIQLILMAATRLSPLTQPLLGYFEDIEKLAYTCAMITGLSRALLSKRNPSWRLPGLADEVALAMSRYPALLAASLLVLVSLTQITNAMGMSSQAVIFCRGVVALVVTLILGALLLRTNKTRRAMVIAGEAPESGTTLAGLIYSGISIGVLISLFGLLVGYISLARFITYEIVWLYIVISSFYLLTQLFRDLCDYLFSPKHPSGKAIKQLLGIGDVRLEQIEVVLSGLGRATLILIAVITTLVGGVGSTFGQLTDRVSAILGGDGLRKLNIIPENLLNAVLALLIGIYLIRSLRRWLDNEFLPKTDMDPGMGASLSTLFSNIGYALVILLTLSSLGVKWTNLAWIVSALSVGIGFGLQEIVKNFVSGLILLTERPVKVGDLISISGVEGDIRRINVRATEIQLSDRSIVIVPNSQLISQNLRNVTMGGSAQGVAILELVFPLDIDPEQVKNLLYDTYCEHETILDHPAPSVRFSKLTPEGITLTITGYVSSPRIVASTKSDLLFEILKRLGAAGIELAKPAPTV
jgi:small-conductance mechanosensitive channel